MNETTLDKIKVGDKAIIKKILNDTSIKTRLLDIGFTKGTQVEKELENMGKSLFAYNVRGTLIAIRKKDLENIIVEVLS